jgi:hypothetical protein
MLNFEGRRNCCKKSMIRQPQKNGQSKFMRGMRRCRGLKGSIRGYAVNLDEADHVRASTILGTCSRLAGGGTIYSSQPVHISLNQAKLEPEVGR